MSEATHGKGDEIQKVDRKKYDANFDIFGKKKRSYQQRIES